MRHLTLHLRAQAAWEVFFLGSAVPAAMLWFTPLRWHETVMPTLVLWPLFLGLRFGFWAGCLAAMQTALVLYIIGKARPQTMGEFPAASAIVVLMVGMVSGEVRDTWERKAQQLRTLHQYHRTRLEQFSSQYRMLQLSHAQLERHLADGYGSLRAALQRIKERASTAEAGTMGELAAWMLDVMAEVGNLHAAAVYAVNERGVLQSPALASMGHGAAFSPFNPMLRETLRTGELTTVHTGPEMSRDQVLAVVPLVDASGRVHAVVAIFDMLFVSIHLRTFEALGILGKHLGDLLSGRPRLVSDPQSWSAFRLALAQQVQLADADVFPVALVACKVGNANRGDALVAHLFQSARNLDQCWVVPDRANLPVVLKIMPLTGEEGIRTYLARLEKDLPGSSFGVQVFHWLLDHRRSADEIVQELVVSCALGANGPGTPTQRVQSLGGTP